jgi:beta-glucosidase-like glycosyl hydrolase
VTRGAGLWAALSLASVACRPPAPAPVVASPSPPSFRWAEETLKRLTLEEKAAQMVGVRVYGLYEHPRSADVQRLEELVAGLKVGCVVVFESEVESVPRVLNDLQSAAPVPLLVAADLERGLAFRVRRGVVPLPHAMAIGATGSEEAARFAGEVTAREARAVGIHWAFAPVADVNSNPANPIVNIRSFGEDPEQVARLSAAFVRGARDGGLLTTAKHFPGHGDTSVDSHLQLAAVNADADRLRRVEMLPFRRDVDAGVDAVMLGHIAVPALDPSGTPASLSAPVGRVLREDLGFKGLIVTDALEMQGVRAAWTGEAAIRAVQAGADMILLPPDARVAVRALVRAVKRASTPPSGGSWKRRSAWASTSGGSWIRRRSAGAWGGRRTCAALSRWRGSRSRSCATKEASCRFTRTPRSGCCTSSSRATPRTTRSRDGPRTS